jgi:hypothetical protein
MLEQRIDEWSNGCSCRRNDEQSKQKQDNDQGQKPKLLSNFQKLPEFFQEFHHRPRQD